VKSLNPRVIMRIVCQEAFCWKFRLIFPLMNCASTRKVNVKHSFAREAGSMVYRFEDPWNQFAHTGRIEDYLQYKRQISGYRLQDFEEEQMTAAPAINAGSTIQRPQNFLHHPPES